jgi:hypothetical protein
MKISALYNAQHLMVCQLGFGLDDRGIEVWFPVRAKDFFSLQPLRFTEPPI